MAGSDFLKEIIKTTGNEYASLATDGIESGDVMMTYVKRYINIIT